MSVLQTKYRPLTDPVVNTAIPLLWRDLQEVLFIHPGNVSSGRTTSEEQQTARLQCGGLPETFQGLPHKHGMWGLIAFLSLSTILCPCSSVFLFD